MEVIDQLNLFKDCFRREEAKTSRCWGIVIELEAKARGARDKPKRLDVPQVDKVWYNGFAEGLELACSRIGEALENDLG